MRLPAALIALLTALSGCILVVDDDVFDDHPYHLDGTRWKLEIITHGRHSYTPAGQTYSLFFESEDELSGRADCNVYGGSYTEHRGKELTIRELHSTEIACGEDSFDALFLDDLYNTDAYEQDGDALTIYTHDGYTLRFYKD